MTLGSNDRVQYPLPLAQRSVLETAAEEAAAEEAEPAVQLEMVRFTAEELGVRPVAVAGTYGEILPAELAAAPAVSSGGAFNSFRIGEGGGASEWVVRAALRSLA